MSSKRKLKRSSLNTAQPTPTSSPGSVMVLPMALQIVRDELELTPVGILITRHLRARAEQGKEKYGTYLETFNGREAGGDLWQEQLDGLMYASQKMMESQQLMGFTNPWAQKLRDWITEHVTQMNNLFFLLQELGVADEEPKVEESKEKIEEDWTALPEKKKRLS